MSNSIHAKRAYRSPDFIRLCATEVTLGNGEAHVDFLGNPLTKYAPLVPGVTRVIEQQDNSKAPGKADSGRS